MTVKPIPEGYHSITPYLIVKGAAEAIEFYMKAFNATEIMRLPGPGGKVMHAEMQIGDSCVMLGEPMEDFDAMPSSIFLTVGDCDAIYACAIAAGGTSAMEVMTMDHAGERYGGVFDPCGNVPKEGDYLIVMRENVLNLKKVFSR